MGYHISILRTRDDEQIPITEEEVVAAIHGSSKFRADKDVRDEPIVEIISGIDPYPCLWYTDGELWTKNPDEAAVDGMCELASMLGGRVRGDELETYRSSSDFYYHPDDDAARTIADQATKNIIRETKKKRIIMKCCIFGFFVVIAIIVGTCSRN